MKSLFIHWPAVHRRSQTRLTHSDTQLQTHRPGTAGVSVSRPLTPSQQFTTNHRPGQRSQHRRPETVRDQRPEVRNNSPVQIITKCQTTNTAWQVIETGLGSFMCVSFRGHDMKQSTKQGRSGTVLKSVGTLTSNIKYRACTPPPDPTTQFGWVR